MFEFIVGPTRKVFKVHTAAIAQQSKALDTLMNGRMSEALAHSATLPDLDADTFVRFCQFAYTGDYDEPAFEIFEPTRNAFEIPVRTSVFAGPAQPARPTITYNDSYDREHTVEVPAAWDRLGLHRGSIDMPQCKHTKRQHLRRVFEELTDYPCTEWQDRWMQPFDARPNRSADEDCTGVFLGHARLYVFAEMYGIEGLRTTALHKLHRTLVTFTLHKARIGDVVALVRYAYSDENTPDRDGGVEGKTKLDALRKLVLRYVTMEYETIGACEKFLNLLMEGGAFVRDFWVEAKTRMI